MNLKSVLRSLTPPVIWRLGSRLFRLRASNAGPAIGREQPPAYYDRKFFKTSSQFGLHYTASRYYPLWTVVADRVRRAGVRSILDIGCGPGQVASMLRDQGLKHYVGLDFSSERVAAARKVCPEFRFDCADAFISDVYHSVEYDCVLSMEFLEHVQRDTDVLQMIRPDTRFIGTVPNFPNTAHVRHFQDVSDVTGRYGPYFRELDVVGILGNENGTMYFLMEGVRSMS
jgi:trans-aconitate methyltransferase